MTVRRSTVICYIHSVNAQNEDNQGVASLQSLVMGSHGLHDCQPFVSSIRLHKMIGLDISKDDRETYHEVGSSGSSCAPPDYPLLIITCAVNSRIIKTPLTQVASADPPAGYKFFLKREDQQISFSAHVRGAYNRMSQVSPNERWRGIVFSAVGHEKYAKAIAWASRLLKMQVTIIVSQSMTAHGIKELRSMGCAVIQAVNKANESHVNATALSFQEQVPHVQPLTDPYYLAGIGTVGLEILQQIKEEPALEAVFCSLQDTAALRAISLFLNRFAPHAKVIGVGLRQSSEQSDRGIFKPLPAIVKEIRAATHFIDALSDAILVDTDEVLKAIADVFGETRVVVDLDGALAVAGMKHYAMKNGRSDGATRSLVAVTSSVDVAFDSFIDSIRVG